MEINQEWSIEWVTFFNEYAGDFHPTFKHKLAQQLFEKGSAETGVRGFEKYNFQLLIGQKDLEMRQIENNMFALVIFITPIASSEPVWIYWTAEDADISTLHTRNVSAIHVEFHWGGNFPKEEILSCLKPYKKEKKDKTGLNFEVEYYYNTFPDISLELVFTKAPEIGQLEAINNSFADFTTLWNSKSKDKSINFVSSLTKKDDSVYEVVADMGIGNSIKTVGLLLKGLSIRVQPNVISKIKVR